MVTPATRFADLPGAAALSQPYSPWSEAEVARLLAQRFGVTAALTRLRTEKDDTFIVEAQPRLVLKVFNPHEDPGVIQMQVAALRHIAETDPTLPVQRLHAPLARAGSGATRASSPDGAGASTPAPEPDVWTDDEGRERLAVLMSFLEGVPMREAAEWPPALVRDCGRVLGRLSLALSTFEHPSGDRDDLVWDLRVLPLLEPLTDLIDDPGIRERMRAYLGDLADPLARLGGLPTQICHQDFHPGNIIVADAHGAAVVGVLDFGDMCRTSVVCDLAVALTYLLTDDGDPFARVRLMLDGFREIRELGDDERTLLPELIRARLALTVLVPMWKADLRPQDAELETRDVAVRLSRLDHLSAMTPRARRESLLGSAPPLPVRKDAP